MITFERSICINRQKQEVFDWMSDPTNDAQWRSGSEFAEWTSDGPIGAGSTLRSVDSFLGRKIEAASEITTWDPPHQYGFKSVGGSFPTKFTFRLESNESGTQLTAGGEIEFSGFFKLVEWLFGKQIKRQVENDFNTLKLLLKGTNSLEVILQHCPNRRQYQCSSCISIPT
jgi:carbon monoxide dehydrogenase subunit G